MPDTKDWVVIRLRNGELRLVRGVVLPVGGTGSVLVPLVPDAEADSVDRVVNASSWRGAKRSARFRSGLACIRCEGTRRTGPLPVALLSRAEDAYVATIGQVAADAWEYAFLPQPGSKDDAPAAGRAPSAESAFDAIAAYAAEHGYELDPRPSPALDAAA